MALTGPFPGSKPGQTEGTQGTIRLRLSDRALPHPRLESAPSGRPPFGLTKREVEVLQCLAGGMSTEEIAKIFSVSHRTVQGHVQGIITKLQVRSKLEAVLSGLRLGIVVLD